MNKIYCNHYGKEQKGSEKFQKEKRTEGFSSTSSGKRKGIAAF